MQLISIDRIGALSLLNKILWKYCWKYWYRKGYVHYGIKEYLYAELQKIKTEKQGLNVLDIGCGSAWSAKDFSSLYEYYVGLDFNEELIQTLRIDFSKSTRCSFYLHDIQTMKPIPSPNGKYEVILANFILLELENLRIFFENVAQVQTKGDYLIISGLDPLNEILRISNSPDELEENLDLYRHSDIPLVLTKEMTFNGEETNLKYLRILYSINDIIGSDLANSYEIVDLNDKLNLHADSPKSPLYYTLKLRRK